MHPEKCPKCKIAWQKEENIYDHFVNQGETKEKATEIASFYGCTKETPKHFGVNVMGIETEEYDGVSYWECTSCKTVFDRWTMKVSTFPSVTKEKI